MWKKRRWDGLWNGLRKRQRTLTSIIRSKRRCRVPRCSFKVEVINHILGNLQNSRKHIGIPLEGSPKVKNLLDLISSQATNRRKGCFRSSINSDPPQFIKIKFGGSCHRLDASVKLNVNVKSQTWPKTKQSKR